MKNATLSIAPMMGRTDRHCRYFHRLLAPSALLYTEMVTTGALIYGDVNKHLQYNDEEHPIALQLGGSDPNDLAKCAKLAQDYGYDEVNLNCGCPSDRVQRGRFGACLMKEPDHVAKCVQAMCDSVKIPITVKCRIGVDDLEGFEFLSSFANKMLNSGASGLSMHARKAWLKGLSPKENREIPPLDYDIVYRLAESIPKLPITINGGITTPQQAASHMPFVAGIMIGRAAYSNPWILAQIDKTSNKTRKQIAEKMMEYINKQSAKNIKAQSITCHMSGLFKDQNGASKWRGLMGTPNIKTADMYALLDSM